MPQANSKRTTRKAVADPVFNCIEACKKADAAADRADRALSKRTERLGSLGIGGAAENKVVERVPAFMAGYTRIVWPGDIKRYMQSSFLQCEQYLPPKTWKRLRAMKSFTSAELQNRLRRLNAQHKRRRQEVGLTKLENSAFAATTAQTAAWKDLFATRPNSARGLATVAKFLDETEIPYRAGNTSDVVRYLRNAMTSAR